MRERSERRSVRANPDREERPSLTEPPSVREATPDDAALLVRVIDMASEGLVPALWDAMAPNGTNGSEIGLSMVTEEDGDFSYRHGLVIEQDGTPLGGLIGYPLPTTPEPIEPEVPEVFVPVKQLEELVPGYWYINVVALEPESRGKDLGRTLLFEAEARARVSECLGLALVVAASKAGAIRAYIYAGYREKARRPFELKDFGLEPTEALLLVKDLT